MQINPNDPAMPHPNHEGVSGISIRAEFAARAMQGLLSGTNIHPMSIAKEAVKIADALIAELNKTFQP